MQRTHGNGVVQRLLSQTLHRTEAPQQVQDAIERERGGGQSLDRELQRQMEPAFGVDFSGVRVHTGVDADAMARAMEATAFTTGSDIFFSRGAYDPGSSRGRHLLAHELTHVIQQNASPVQGAQTRMTVSQPHDREELEADDTAKTVMNRLEGGAASTGPHTASFQRQQSEGAVPPAAIQRQTPAEETPAADPLHAIEIWIDYNDTLKKAGGKPVARGPSSALYVDDLRLVPNKMGTNPKGFHLSGIDVGSSGGAKLGVVQHPEADGLVSGVIRFGTTPSVKLDASITYLGEEYIPLEDEEKKALEPTMKAAKKDAAKVAQKALAQVGDAAESEIKREVEAELRAAYRGLDFTVASIIARGTSEAFSLPAIPYDAVMSDRLMKLWVNVPSTGFTQRYDYETADRVAVGKEVVESKGETDVTKAGGTSSVSTTTIDKVIKEIEVDLKQHIWTNRDHLKTKNETTKWTIGAKMSEELKGSLGASGKATLDVSKLLPVSKIPLIGKAVSKLGLIPSLPVELNLKADGSGEWKAEQHVSREKFDQETESWRDQTIKDWQSDVKIKEKAESYKSVTTTLTAYWDVYHKTETFRSEKDTAAAERATRKAGQSVSITYQAGQPYLTVGAPDRKDVKIIS